MSAVLVTGGGGFLGSHIADALSDAGHQVILFDRAESPWLRTDQKMILGDVTDAAAVEEAVQGCDYVYHLAALADLNAAKSRPLETVTTNIAGTLNILEACRKYAVKRLLFSSTVYVYSREGSFYRCSKQACENYIEEYQASYGLEYSILRFGSLYGPRADASNGVFRLLKKAIVEQNIDYDGSPSDLRNYIHVKDAARLSVRALGDEFANEHLVLTGSDALKIEDLFRMFSEITGKQIETQFSDSDDPQSMKGHYSVTPYAYTPRPGLKITANPYIDMGQGLLELVEVIDRGLTSEL